MGSGGVITPGIQSIQPWVWKYAWPQNIQNELFSHTNTKGRLTINDLELAGLVLGWLVLEYVVADMRFKRIESFCDNKPAVAWKYIGSTSTPILMARLIKFFAPRQLERKVSSLTPMSIARKENAIADITSQEFKDEKCTEAHKI